MLYPYRGRIIRPQSSDNSVGAVRTTSGHRYVTTVYDGLQLSRRRSDNQGERALHRAGSVGKVQFRFQTPAYLPKVETDDELVLISDDGELEAYNIVMPAPSIGRPGIGGRTIGAYTVLLAQRKDEQNADMDIYL
ncbi:MAG: hypothetical protein OXG44_01395 [Gammaproteobacteria bacterium]|nr:hypothetical protein [Gammaproteobacteria bacterium]